MEIKLFDSELKVMDILWKEGDTSAKDIAEILNRQVGWSKTTTYTVIKKCINKGAAGQVGAWLHLPRAHFPKGSTGSGNKRTYRQDVRWLVG